MLKLNKLLLLFYNPKRFFYGLYIYLDWLVIDKIIFFVTFIIFSLFPKYLYLVCNKPFPLFKKHERWIKKNNPEDEWYYKDKKRKFNEINIICRGNYKKYLNKINKKLITFFVHFDHKPNIKIPYIGICGGGFGKRKYITWQMRRFNKGVFPIIHSRGGWMKKNGKIRWEKTTNAYPNYNNLKKIDKHLPEDLKGTYKIYTKKRKYNKKIYNICKLISKKATVHFKDFDQSKNYGTALATIFLLGSSSKKVNVYGWDYYLKQDVEKYSYWELFKTISQSSKKKGYAAGTYWDVNPKGPWGERTSSHFSQGIFNLHYASRLIGQKKYKIFSRLSKINKQKRFLKNIEKIFFN